MSGMTIGHGSGVGGAVVVVDDGAEDGGVVVGEVQYGDYVKTIFFVTPTVALSNKFVLICY